ncbi:uncharacterized protein LOC126904924 [Daktulosphaira vitifoliae]|uniref:uncharacterized protein LOC126904924 n=1 Tax=Daktulosphaira vitifoliae TaxID=58002 RepID=UPI0021AA7233|nr:uncharacterized protein LOC126904924 [Daktulosphaira vitifoliae]
MSKDNSCIKLRKIYSFFGPNSHKGETETACKKIKIENTENEEWEVQSNDTSIGTDNHSSDSDDFQQLNDLQEIKNVEPEQNQKQVIENQMEIFSKIGPSDITHIVSDPPTQPILKNYPQSKFGKEWRQFRPEWFKSYPWLEYSVLDNACYCFPCRFFSHNSDNSPFYKIGFKNWKKALDKNAGIKGHNKSCIHKTCMTKWEGYKNSKKTKSILTTLNEANLSLIKENRYYISVISEILLFTACQNIAQRGDDEGSESLNRGNFLELLELCARRDARFKAKIDILPKNAKYTHHTIQNDLFYVMSKLVLETIAKEVKEAKYFAILADETKDVSKTEQLSIMVRYYHNNTMNERFLGEIKIVSDYLQKPDSDLGSSCLLVESLINYLMEFRNTSNKFEDLLTEVELCAQKNNIQLPNETVKETRIRKLPKQFSSYITEVTTSEILDRMVSELNRRFSDHSEILTGISALIPKCDTFLNFTNIKPLAEHYKLDIESLESELTLITKLIKRHEAENAFSEMYILCIISIIIPPSSAGVERTFSSLRQIKNYMRNKMTNKRLSNIAILSIEKKIAKNLDLEVVVDKFAAIHKNRRILLT